MERTIEQIRMHYLVERELADRLRAAPAGERPKMYGQLYDELFRRVPEHPQLTRKAEPKTTDAIVEERMHLLRRFLGPDEVFMEIGAGDCTLSNAAARHVKRAYAVEVSREIFADVKPAPNLELVLSGGCDLPVPDGSVTIAYSNQVIEHIHPDDAAAQLASIHQALAPGGRYLCITPNRINGPHDVSRFFDPVARGFHIKEYSVGDLDKLFRAAGFAKTEAYVGLHHRYAALPVPLLRAFEGLLDSLPAGLRKWIGHLPVVRNVLFVSLVATKAR